MDTIWKEFFEGFNLREFGRMAALYAKEALIHSKEGPIHGPNSVELISRKWLTQYPKLQLQPLHQSCNDDVLTVHWVAQDGDETLCHGHTCFRCENDQVIEHWACIDYRQLARKTADR